MKLSWKEKLVIIAMREDEMTERAIFDYAVSFSDTNPSEYMSEEELRRITSDP